MPEAQSLAPSGPNHDQTEYISTSLPIPAQVPFPQIIPLHVPEIIHPARIHFPEIIIRARIHFPEIIRSAHIHFPEIIRSARIHVPETLGVLTLPRA